MPFLALFRIVALATSVNLAAISVAVAAAPIFQLTSSTGADVRPSWSPDGKRIAFQSNRSGDYQIYVVGADGSNEKALTTTQQDFRHPAWSPDGKLLAVDAGGSGVREVYTIDVETGQMNQVTRLGTNLSFPSFSPDGKKLSFFAYKDGELALWTVAADGSDPKLLVPAVASEKRSQCTFACHSASWSPDSSRLAVATSGQAEVWTVNAVDGTDLRKISPDGENSHFPLYLSDGRLLYVTEHVTPGHSWTDVWAVQPGVSDTPDLVLGDIQAQGPFEFSSDGQQLLFASPRNGNFEVYLVTLSAEGKEALKTKSGETQPAPGMAHPAGLPGGTTSAPVTSANVPASGASAPAAAAPTSTQTNPATGPEAWMYLGALGAVALVWLGVEASAWRRRRRSRDN
jgi:Tol biopolymer transport system component